MTNVWCKAIAFAAGLSTATSLLASAGCSSSSSGAAQPLDAAIPGQTEQDSSFPSDGPQASEPSEAGPVGKSLLWNVVTPASISRVDGGLAAGGSDSGIADASIVDAGLVDAGVADASADGAAAPANVPVPGAHVCVYQSTTIPCATTAADGTFMLTGLPTQKDIVITVEKNGYRSALRPIETASTNMDGTGNPINLTAVAAPDPSVPVSVDWQNKGQLTLFAIAPLPDAGSMFGGDPGATVALSPMSGSGPFFPRDDGTVDLTATSLVGVAGEYFNLDPGNYVLAFTDTKHTCAPISFPFGAWGYPAPPTSVKFPIMAGYVTGPIGIFCTSK